MSAAVEDIDWLCNACDSKALTKDSLSITCQACAKEYRQVDGVWECAPGFIPAGFGEDRSADLQQLEEQHFWFSARDSLLADRLSKITTDTDQRLLELGCSSGRFLNKVCRQYAVSVGVEGHMAALQKAAGINRGLTFIHADVTHTPLVDEQFDCLLALDVLEHVEPIDFLKEAYRLTRPGGSILISVPAFPILWSHMDKLAGHRCRYRLADLRSELQQSGWILMGHTHFQFLLFPLLAVSRLMSRNKQSALERKPPGFINSLLGKINDLEVLLFKRVTLPFGSSLVIWARKPNLENNEK